MTKSEHARIVAWRLRILQHAEKEPRYVAQTCRYFGISRTPYFGAHQEISGLDDKWMEMGG